MLHIRLGYISNLAKIYCIPLEALHCLRASLKPSQRERSDCCWAHWMKLLISQAQAPVMYYQVTSRVLTNCGLTLRFLRLTILRLLLVGGRLLL